MAEYASDKMRKIYKINIEIMSAIPSVVLGFLGLYIFSDIIQSIFKLDTGLTALTGGMRNNVIVYGNTNLYLYQMML